jgi:hypothetical protein
LARLFASTLFQIPHYDKSPLLVTKDQPRTTGTPEVCCAGRVVNRLERVRASKVRLIWHGALDDNIGVDA